MEIYAYEEPSSNPEDETTGTAQDESGLLSDVHEAAKKAAELSSGAK